MNKYIPILIALSILGFTAVCEAQNINIPEEVKENIRFRVDNNINAGIVVGVITPGDTSYYSYGVKSYKTKEAVDENSVFEIGSISKTFTAILLADMHLKAELNLDDPLQSLLPDGITAPTRNGESIKLYQMANHTSSLPGMPDNLTPTTGNNPFADYSEEQLYAFIDSYKLTRDIGSEYEYSNYALGLLGYVLAEKCQMTYEDLLMERILIPLGMRNTSTLLTSEMKDNLAMGYSNGSEVESWFLPTLAGAGAIRSTAVDMLKYLAANLDIKKSNLYSAMQLSHKNTRKEGDTPMVGLAWHTRLGDNSEIIYHTGVTGGYVSFAGFGKGKDKGVVVLSNSDAAAAVYYIGMHLLDSTIALDRPKIPIGTTLRFLIENKGIENANKTYWELKENQNDKYDFEEYQLNMLGYSYKREGEAEKAKAVFKLNTEAFPNSSNAYDSYAEALMESNEKALAIINYKKSVELNPGNTKAIEILKKSGVNTNEFVKEVSVDDKILQSYVGSYHIASGFNIAVIKDGNQLYIQPTGQGVIDIYPLSDNVFYLKALVAQITFNLNDNGEVESLTLLQGGRETTGNKINDK